MRIGAGLFLAMMFLTMVPAALAEERETGAVELPEAAAGFTERLFDDDVKTRVPVKLHESVTMRFDEAMQGLALKWYAADTAYTLAQYDEAGALLQEERAEPGLYNRYHALLPACRTAVVMPEAAAALCEAAWYPADEALPDDVQRWEKPEGRVDLMALVVRPGEELTELGGLLPLYAGEHDIKTCVAFLSCDKRSYAEEALTGLWRIGCTDYPLFLNLPLQNAESEKTVDLNWGTSQLLRDTLIRLYRQWQPRVVVFGGAGDHATAAGRFAAAMLPQVAEYAFNERYDRASVAEDGLWQVQKIYIQREPTGEESPATVVDWTQSLNTLFGMTAQAQAAFAYADHPSQVIYRRAVPASSAFVLAYTAVGDDAARNDLFEHISVGDLLCYAAPTPTPSPAPTPTPTPAQTPTPMPVPLSAARMDRGTAIRLPAFVTACGLLLSLALLILIKKRIRIGKNKAAALCLCLIPLLAALLIAGGLSLAARKRTAALAAITPTPSSTATPAPTLTTTPTATPAPTPTPKWEEHFRLADEPAEVISVDAENGRWQYKTDTLGIDIERRTEREERKIVTYFVAHVYMRSYYDFRAAFGSDGRTGRGTMAPWIIARRARAVLMVSGDNMLNMEKEWKGIILRDGRKFSDHVGDDTVALMPDMSLEIFAPGEITAEALMEAGVENSFSFGPTLIHDGVINENAGRHRVRSCNPRMGIGMVEPGHLVVIAVDGRDSHYSIGMMLPEYAEVFAREGCTEAYNLDGGASVAMLFMGEQINYHANHPGDVQRPIPDGLVWGYSDQVPTEFDPIYNKGRHGEEGS